MPWSHFDSIEPPLLILLLAGRVFSTWMRRLKHPLYQVELCRLCEKEGCGFIAAPDIFYTSCQYKLLLCLLLLRTFLSSIPCFWSDTEALWSLPVRELPPICTDVRQKQRISIDTLPPEVKAPFPSDPIIPLRTKTTKEFQWVSSLQTLVPNPWHCPADSPKNQTFSAQNNKDYILGRTWSTLSNQVTGGTSESFTWQPSTHS